MFPLFFPSPLDADFLTPELLHTVHSRMQHGLAIAWLTVEWPVNIIPIPETFTLLQASFLSQCNVYFHYLFALNYFVANSIFLKFHSAHCLKAMKKPASYWTVFL